MNSHETTSAGKPSELHPLLLPEILFQIGSHLSQATVLQCLPVCRTWRACLSPYLFQRVTLPRRQSAKSSKRTSRPMIAALQRNASNIRTLICADNNAILNKITPHCIAIETLVLGRITPEVLPILRLCKDKLVRLEFSPDRHFQPPSHYPQTATVPDSILLSSPPTILGCNTAKLTLRQVADLLEAITDLSRLEHLVLDHLGLRSERQLLVFFEYCQRLSSLELHHTAVMGAAPSGLVFRDMRSLSVVDCVMPLTYQMVLIHQCPYLTHVTWIRGGYVIPIDSIGLWTVDRRELKSLDVSKSMADDSVMATTLTQLLSLESLIVRESLFGPASFSVVLSDLGNQIQVLDLVDCKSVTPEMVHEILGSCRALKSLSADRIRVMDVTESPKPWICQDLEELRIVFVGPVLLVSLSLLDVQRAVYDRIATLRRLRLLSLGRCGSSAKWSTKSVLDLSLAAGLGRLSSLQELQEFDFCRMAHKLGMEEFKFMMRYWPKLEAMHGYLHADKDREAFIESYLRSERPGIKLKHHLKYRRNVTRLELN